ncbi:DUF3108 domain-containing protein [Neptuniibacter halophilus]|uniref:DUF3108 domain-containing protein n=1 Tax=Neptuniibacter halophilus TaxID=651666 RepID=UPI00257325A6|nr:DUF3108 domain-containing protein [Neptuniibacter halophilus]
MPGIMRKLLLTTLSTALLSSAVQAGQPSPGLAPFTASYEIDWDGSISLSGDTVRQLKQGPEQQWQFESKASAMFASIYESSRFTWHNQIPQPLEYNFKRSVLGKKRLAEVHFDWQNSLVTNKVENKPWKMEISEGVQDKISYQLLLQQEVAAGKQDFNYSVADGGHLKEYRFKVDGREQIEAPIGSYEAIRVIRVRDEDSNRQTYIWFAPELDYQIIKLKQIEKKDKAYTLLLRELAP